MRCCGWTFIKRKNWAIRKNYFIFSSSKQKTFLQSWIYWKKRELWLWLWRLHIPCEIYIYWRCKIHWQVKRYYTNIIINISFFSFFDNKWAKVWINEHILDLGTEKIVLISKCLNYRVSNWAAQNIRLSYFKLEGLGNLFEITKILIKRHSNQRMCTVLMLACPC